MDSYGEYTTAQQELDEIELGRQPSHDLRFGQDIRWILRVAWLIQLGKFLQGQTTGR